MADPKPSDLFSMVKPIGGAGHVFDLSAMLAMRARALGAPPPPPKPGGEEAADAAAAAQAAAIAAAKAAVAGGGYAPHFNVVIGPPHQNNIVPPLQVSTRSSLPGSLGSTAIIQPSIRTVPAQQNSTVEPDHATAQTESAFLAQPQHTITPSHRDPTIANALDLPSHGLGVSGSCTFALGDTPCHPKFFGTPPRGGPIDFIPGSVIGPPQVMATILPWAKGTGSELNEKQAISVKNAIGLVKCLGFEAESRRLLSEFDENDIEVADSAPKNESGGWCEFFPIFPGDWLYLTKDLLDPLSETFEQAAGRASLPKEIGPCNPAIIKLAAVLYHESLHLLGTSSEDRAHLKTYSFLVAVSKQFDKCFQNCTEDQLDYLWEEIHNTWAYNTKAWERAIKEGQATGPVVAPDRPPRRRPK